MQERLFGRDPLVRFVLQKLIYQVNYFLRRALHQDRCHSLFGRGLLWDCSLMQWVDMLHLGGCRAAFGVEYQGKLMCVAVAFEECVTGGCRGSFDAITVLVVACTEELCENATCGPEVYLHSVVCIAVEQLRGSVVACRDVSHTSPRGRFSWCESLQRPVVTFK